MKKGDRVYVVFKDLSADLHTDGPIQSVTGELVGWIVRQDKSKTGDIEFTYCRYKDGCNLRDGIAIPKGCIISMEKI